MKNLLVLLFASASLSAAPIPPEGLALRTTFNLAADASVGPSSTYNPRYFDANVYLTQINTPAFGYYRSGAATPLVALPATFEHRMLAPFRGANSSTYLFGASGATSSTFTRYDFSGENPVEVNVPGDAQASEGFDWVDENTIIYTTYNPSANRKRLSLAHVVADPFEVTPDTRWNANGYITSSVTTRIRNVRVGDLYSGYAYYGDAGQNDNPKIYALNLVTGAETLIGNAGPLTGAGSFGLWTVVERGGYLYVQTTDNGIQVWNMTGPTTLGTLDTIYAKARLDELTGYSGQYYGFDVSPDGKKILLGSGQGTVFELGPIPPLVLKTAINLAADAATGGSSIYNPRFFDADIFTTQINTPALGRYPSGSSTPAFAVIPSFEHRMLAPFRGANSTNYLLAASGATSSSFTRYDFADGANPVESLVPGDAQAAESYDWVDDNTIIYTTYNPSANRKRLALAHVVADPFEVTPDTRWNANGYITTGVSTRIRNVRVGDPYNGYAYYGDAGQNNNPNFYAINLATGAETLLGNAGLLTGTGSFGLWTVVERGGNLYVQTTDNGIQVYKLTSPTTLGSLLKTYTKEDLDFATGYTGQYWGFDVSSDRNTFLLGGGGGMTWELTVRADEPLNLEIARSGNNIVLTWTAPSITDIIVQSSPTLSAPNFTDMSPQPPILADPGTRNLIHATIPISGKEHYFRLRR